MQISERTKEEVIKRAEKMSDFLRMEYLENCIRKFNDKEILGYSFLELSKSYERNIMYGEAIKYLSKYEEVAFSLKEKLIAFQKEIELSIKAGLYDRIDFTLKKAKEIASPKELFDIEKKIIDELYKEGDKFFRQNKFSPAQKAYEKLLLTEKGNKDEIRKKLFVIYNKLGKVREAIEIERKIGS